MHFSLKKNEKLPELLSYLAIAKAVLASILLVIPDNRTNRINSMLLLGRLTNEQFYTWQYVCPSSPEPEG